MTLLCKQKALYVKCCIIQNGVADFHNDILNAEDIKRIFTTFNNQNSFEIYHNEIPISEVSLLENYISTNEEVIAGTNVPAGSWNAVIRVDNPTIKQQLMNKDFGGVSLNNRIQTRCSTGLSGNITYSDLRDAECVIPVYISFVNEPANDVGLHIMDYNVYIKKSKNSLNGDGEMSLLEDLKALISKAEQEAEADTPTDAADKPVEEEEVAVEEEEKIEKEADDEEEPNAEADDSEEEEEAEKIEKAEGEEIIEEIVEDTASFDAAAEIEAIKTEIANLKAEVEALKPVNPIDEGVTAADVNPNEPIVVKSAKIETTTAAAKPVRNFYEMTGRDALTGKKIRKETKILN